MPRLPNLVGRRLPMLRWSVWRTALGYRNLIKAGQVGDGRERALARHVVEHARPGDVDDAIRVIDQFGYQRRWLMNVGDEKGEILDAAVRRARPRVLLELGAYCGYSALRMARAMPPTARLVSVELSADNARVARQVWDHAGLGDRVSVVVGSIGDGGDTLRRLVGQCGFGPGMLDFVFIDHHKDAYLPDLQSILDQGWLRPGSVVVADNVLFPGAPRYREHMKAHEGRDWRTVEHPCHVEYQTMLKDLVLESEYLGHVPDGQARS